MCKFKLNNVSLLFIVFLIIFSVTSFAYVNAQATQEAAGGIEKTLNDPLNNTFSQPNGIQNLIGTIIKAVLGVVGSLALVMFIYGGLLWMTAAGNTERVEKGKKTIVWAVLGLVVIFTSYALVKFILLAIGVKDK